MKCPHCGAPKSVVIDSRQRKTENVRYRRYACYECNRNWTTMESPVEEKNVKVVVLCEDCAIHGCCMMENALKQAGSKEPYCSAGKARNDSGKNKGNT